jgi:hypothetical protein
MILAEIISIELVLFTTTKSLLLNTLSTALVKPLNTDLLKTILSPSVVEKSEIRSVSGLLGAVSKTKKSLPPPPTMRSLPLPPMRVSLPSVATAPSPTILSSPSPPIM